jgi:methionyl-tRNA formyltransferase
VTDAPESFDLLLGSDIGLWIAARVNPADVAAIVTRSDEIAAEARRRGIAVRSEVATTAAAGSRGSAGSGRRALSAHWPVVLTQPDLDLYEAAWNIHPGLLPWGRGYGPVFWALWAGEPAGASLHVMTAGLDKGPVVDQRAVEVGEADTAATLYPRVLDARKELFSEWWPRLVAGERPVGTPQAAGGSYHSRSDFLALRDSGSVAGLSASDLVRLCRALAMPGMPGPMVAPGVRLRLDPDQ